MKSENSDTSNVKFLLLLLYVVGYVALGICLLYVALSVKLSNEAKRDLSVMGVESVNNLVQDHKVSISNYCFLALAILCKLATACLLLLEMMNYVEVNS